MNNHELALDAMRRVGRSIARELQTAAGDMTGAQLYAGEEYLPAFAAARANANMLERPAGFVCRSSAGRVVRLVQPYDSTVYPQEPEELEAQWSFCWSTDPAKALPFLSLAASPYQTGDCCAYAGRVWRSGQDCNVWAPGTEGVSWEDLGPAEA